MWAAPFGTQPQGVGAMALTHLSATDFTSVGSRLLHY